MFKIFWHSTPLVRMTVSDLMDKVEQLNNEGYTEATHKFDIRAWAGKKYRVDDRRESNKGKLRGCITLYINECFSEYSTELCRYYAVEGDTKDRVNMQGIKPGSIIKETFKVIEGKRMRDVFGTTCSDDLMQCVPKPLYFIQKNMQFMNIENVKCIDMTAMYPSCANGKLPTTKDSIKVNGRIKPNKEYPFAFYLKSGHCAEYGGFDTHDYTEGNIPRELKDKLILNADFSRRYKNIEDKDEVTWLMKAADKNLERLFNYFYEKRQTSEDELEQNICKFVMNAGIGTLHRNPNHRYGNKKGLPIAGYYHIAAIIKARANQKMINAYRRVTLKGNLVLQIIVDSIIYTQDVKDNLGQYDKQMGTFHIECENAVYRSNGKINQYVIADNNGELIKIRCAGVENTDIETLEDIDKYSMSKEDLYD